MKITLSKNEMIREAARELEGFCKTQEVKRYVKAKWQEEVSSQSIWNVLGSEKSRTVSRLNAEQRKNAKRLLDSVHGDSRVAIQLIKIEGVGRNEEI